MFNQTPFKKGHDLEKSEQKLEQAKTDAQRVDGSLLKAGASLNRVTTLISNIINGMSASEQKKYALASNIINKYKTPEKKEKTSKKSNGRVAKDRKVDKTVTASLKSHTCCKCGGTTVVYENEKLVENVISGTNALNSLLQVVKNAHEVEVCEKCGNVSLAISDNQDLPVVPNREIGIDYILTCSDFICRGMALNNYIAPLKGKFELGNDTISYNLHDFIRIYIKPLYDGIIEKAKSAQILLLDGTPFDCLESQGKRKSKNSSLKEEDEVSKSNYILSMSSPAHAESKFTAYAYLPKRNSQSIRAVITDDYKFKVLVTDGFTGYDALAEAHPGTKLMHCLTHLRRYLLESFDFKRYCESLDVLDDENCKSFIEKEIKDCSDKYLLYSAFTVINKIYELESYVDYTQSDWKQKLKDIRVKCKELIENADIVM